MVRKQQIKTKTNYIKLRMDTNGDQSPKQKKTKKNKIKYKIIVNGIAFQQDNFGMKKMIVLFHLHIRMILCIVVQ